MFLLQSLTDAGASPALRVAVRPGKIHWWLAVLMALLVSISLFMWMTVKRIRADTDS